MDSVISQTYRNLEIIVVNDGSTDNSLDKVLLFDDKRIKIFTKKNGGLSLARNFGIEKSNGDYIAFIDADDEWEPKILEYLLLGFKNFPNSILICSDLVELSENESTFKRRLLPYSINEQKINYHKIENYLSTLKDAYFLLSGCSVLIKKEIIKNHELFFFKDSEPAEDVNYWIRLNQLGDFIFCDYLGLKYHRVDPNSIMNKKNFIPKKIPPFFHKVNLDNYSEQELKEAEKFLEKEYLKKAYQNRGLKFSFDEFSMNSNEIKLGIKSKIFYIIVRYVPINIIKILKKGFKS